MTEPDVIERELTAIDAALESGATTASDPYELELQELALALAADAPEPRPEFARELDGRVAKGFPRKRRLPRLTFPTLSKPVLAAAASVVAALVVATALVANGGGDDPVLSDAGSLQSTESLPTEGGAGTAAAPPAGAGADAEAAAGADVQASAPPPAKTRALRAGSGFATAARQRIERSASLSLAAPGAELDKVAAGINRVTERHDGFVLRSDLATGDEGAEGGRFELRIPATRLQAALADLAKLADVRARSQSGQDVTREYANAADRLQSARAERRSLLRRLENATSDTQAEVLRRRLDANAGEIRSLRAQIRDLNLRTDYSKVSVTLETGKGGSGGFGGADTGDGLGGAVDDALGSLGNSVEILIRVLGVAIPLGLLATALALGARVVRRRRREAALS